MASTWLQVLPPTSINRAQDFLPCGMKISYLRRPGNLCLPLYSLMGVSTPSSAPTSLRTARDRYQPVLTLCPSGRRTINLLVPIFLLGVTELRMLQPSRGGGIPQTSPPPVGSLLRATPAGVLASLRGTPPPHQGRSTSKDHRNPPRPLILFAAQWLVPPSAPACNHMFSKQCSTKNAPTPWTRYPWSRFSPGCPPPCD